MIQKRKTKVITLTENQIIRTIHDQGSKNSPVLACSAGTGARATRPPSSWSASSMAGAQPWAGSLCPLAGLHYQHQHTHIRTRWQDHVPHGFQKKVFQSVPGGIARQHLQATWLAILGENPDFKACSKNGPREPWAVHSARKSWFYHLKIILTQ